MIPITVLLNTNVATLGRNGLAVRHRENSAYNWAYAPLGAQSVNGSLTASSTAQARRIAIAMNTRIT